MSSSKAAHRLELPERQHLAEGLVRLVCSVLQSHHVLQQHWRSGRQSLTCLTIGT